MGVIGNGVKRVSQKTVVEGKQEKLSEIRRRTSRISAVSVSVSGQVHKETIVKHMFNPSGHSLLLLHLYTHSSSLISLCLYSFSAS